MTRPQLPPSDDVARACLERVAVSRVFAGSPKLAAFLRFVVEETLAGRGNSVKEYSVGVGALGKPTGFDPANDSTVRVAARQLRFKLSEYFAEEGRDDALVIELPKGAYVPQFTLRKSSSQLGSASDESLLPEAAEPKSAAGTAIVPARASWTRFLKPALILGTAVAATALVTAKLAGSKQNAAETSVTTQASSIASAGKPLSIVVLPFLNLSGTDSEEYVSDGITEEITAMLARSSDLRVVARTSAFRYKATTKDVRTIASEVSANAVLEGSVRKSNDKYRVTAQLISATDGVHLWASTFDIDKTDLFKAYDDIAHSVTSEINRQLHANITRVPTRLATRDPQAHALFLEARFNWNKRTPDAIKRSVTLYGQALRRDSAYALAYAGLADAYATMAVNSITKAGESPPKAIAAAERAIQLDPTLGEPHAAIGLMRAFQYYDWTGADAEFAQAIRLSPNYSTAHAWYSITLLARGRFDEAMRELELAQQLDPLSLAHAYGVAENRFYARQWDQAEAKAKRILELDSTFLEAYKLLGKIYAFSNRPVQARAAFLKAKDTLMLVQLDTAANKHVVLRTLMKTFPAEWADQAPVWMASLEVTLGDMDAAFKWINHAHQIRQLDLVSIKVDPVFDGIRRDARYTALLRTMKLN
ncbi:MAG: hypothetical protein H7Z40_09540 [Phycisphaerae bacterium]|nr:hypothetical protein [Gemmatimonadaceae bacterium]